MSTNEACRLPICDECGWSAVAIANPWTLDYETLELRKAACFACRRAVRLTEERVTRLPFTEDNEATLHDDGAYTD